jgi:hypothetical protein
LSDDKTHEYGYFLFKLQSIKKEGIYFSMAGSDYGHPGTPRLFTDKKFYTPSQNNI